MRAIISSGVSRKLNIISSVKPCIIVKVCSVKGEVWLPIRIKGGKLLKANTISL
jgi:hypothetical protein